MKIGQVIRDEFDNKKDLSGIGGVETGRDAAEFLLLGANSVQVSIISSWLAMPFCQIAPSTCVTILTAPIPLVTNCLDCHSRLYHFILL